MSQVETRYGLLTVPEVINDIIGLFLARYGEWAWCEASFIASVIQDGARVLDVGAFVGTFGLGVALSRPLGFLCCVEANPAVAGLLEGNVAGKTGCSVAVVEALVAGPGPLARTGRYEPGNLGSMSFCVDDHPENRGVAPVRTVTLADLRAEYGAFDLIKLDVEGMEMEALHGDMDHLAKGNTILWIECNEDRRSLDVARLLLSWNLDLFYFAFPSYNPDNFNGDPEAVFPLAFEAGILAGPRIHPSLTMDLKAQGCILKALRSVDDLKDALWRTPRWGMPEWEGAISRQELAALAGRALRGESFDAFLKAGGPTEPDKATTIWQRLEVAEVGLREARALLDGERSYRGRLEEGLAAAEKLAFERLDQLNAEWQRRERTEDGLRKAEALAVEQQMRASSAETELARACARALAHLSALGEARDHAPLMEEELRAVRAAAKAERLAVEETLEARLRIAVHALDAIRASTVWRVSRPVRAFVGRKPALHAVMRQGRAVAGSILRRWRR